MTADPRANQRTNEQLAYLQHLHQKAPSSIISGCLCLENARKLKAVTDRHPALLGEEYCYQYGCEPAETARQAILWREVNPGLIEHGCQGGLIRILTHFPNPCNINYGGLRDRDADIDAILMSGTPERARWLALLDEVAAGFHDLNANGLTVIYGPLHEMNCPGFWWGVPHDSVGVERYRSLWRDLFWYISQERECHNVLWLFAAHGHDPFSDEIYPDDDVVDLIGLDLYSPSLSSHMANYRILAQHDKPLLLSEFGVSKKHCQENGDFDCRSLLSEIRTHWTRTIGFMFWGGEYAAHLQQGAREMMEDPGIVALPACSSVRTY